MRRLVDFIKAHRKGFKRASIAFGILAGVPLVVLAGYQVIQAVDSSAFCTGVCHSVHLAETVTYEVSPHAEVACASCHVGVGTENLVRSKLGGLKDIIPTITGNYPRPIPAPLKDQRPAAQTCEKCHSAEKFFGDVPVIHSTFASDAGNTKSTVTQVLKIGGGSEEVASGIHWHSTATVWYLPLDPQRLKIGWVGVQDTAGKITEYVDPVYAAEVTPERIQAEKRLMDCVDCHNRVPHEIDSPDALLDKALASGSIDPTLPFIKREAISALVLQNTSLSAAYARVAAIKDFYRVAYPDVFATKAAAIDQALSRLKEIARLTTFSDGLDWTTYADQEVHDQPSSDMTIDFASIAAMDNSPGCFRCHGNLVKVQDQTGSGPAAPEAGVAYAIASQDSVDANGAPTPDTGVLAAQCNTCHYTLDKEPDSPVAPATPHPVDGLDNCLACHAPGAARPFKSTHPWSTNEACNTCHQAAPKLKSIPAADLEAENPIPHPSNKLEDCLGCHGPTGAAPFKTSHPWATNETCSACHAPASSLKAQSAGTGEQSKQIPHPVNKLTDCLACHGPNAAVPFPSDHPWSTNSTCAACHQLSPTAENQPVSSLPAAAVVTHPTAGLGECTSCHNSTGPAPFPSDHEGRPDSFCVICHKTGTPVASPRAPLQVGPKITHTITGLGACSSCHNTSGKPAPLPANHVGRPDSFCAICHQVSATATQPPSSAPPTIPHALDTAHQDCLSCHGPSGVLPVSSTHSGRTNSTCLTCHTAGSGGTTTGSTTAPPAIPHALDSAHQNCLSCHGVNESLPASHAGRTNSTCLACHTTASGGTSRPAAPGNLAGSAASETRVELTWRDNSGNESGFRIQRATNSSFSSNVATVTLGANVQSYNDSTVSANTTYYYRVSAYNSAGNSSPSNTVSVTTPSSGTGAATPPVPTNLVATAVSPSQVNLTWRDNATDETGYRIDRATNSTFTSGLATFTVAVNATAYSDGSVAGGTTYYYRVFATGSSGRSPASNTAMAATPAASVDAAALYSSNCASCHGANRQGGVGPALTPASLAGRTVSWLVSFITGHRSGLTSAQVSALADYIKNTPP